MCAPRNQLAQLALTAAVGYATGGSSLFASSAATSSGFLASGAAGGASLATQASTLSTLANAARIALPVIGAAGQVYSGYLQSQQALAKASFVDYQASQEIEASALRRVKRNRELARAVGKQRALYGISGVTLEDTPGDVISLTASNFAEDQYIDDFNTSQSILSKRTSADNLRRESKNLIIGGYTNAAGTLGTRGIDDILTTTTNYKKG